MSVRLTGRYFEDETRDNDRWDLIAYRWYGDASLQHVVLDANRALFVDPAPIAIPAILPAGLAIRVPELETRPADDTLPPWKRGAPTVAEASGGASS